MSPTVMGVDELVTAQRFGAAAVAPRAGARRAMTNSAVEGYDLIGDIHSCATQLEALLAGAVSVALWLLMLFGWSTPCRVGREGQA